MKKILIILKILLISITIINYNSTVAANDKLIGGSVQGTALNLKGKVTNLTGTKFNSPAGITTDGRYIYITSFRDHIIRKINISTGEIKTIVGNRCFAYIPKNVSKIVCPVVHRIGKFVFLPDIDPGLYWPRGITTDGTHLYITDYGNSLIRQIEISSGIIETLAGSGNDGFLDGIGRLASFNKPRGITTDGKNLYINDTDNNSVRKLVISTREVTTLVDENIFKPRGITTDGKFLYVTEGRGHPRQENNHFIHKIEISSGEMTTIAGTGFQGLADGIGRSASFNTPAGIASDGINLYITDEDNHSIRKIVISSGEVTTIAGTGFQGLANGTGKSASFHYPLAIVTDGKNLYIADYDNSLIRKIE